jgi:hypothetical protein
MSKRLTECWECGQESTRCKGWSVVNGTVEFLCPNCYREQVMLENTYLPKPRKPRVMSETDAEEEM